METLSKNSTSLGYYKTMSLSTIGELENCEKIALYLANGSKKLSLDKLSKVDNIEDLLLEGTYLIINKTYNSGKGKFLYYKNSVDNPLTKSGFNTIVYINYNKPIGYTEFTYTQGIISEELTIELKFVVNSGNIGQEIKLIDNLKIDTLQRRVDIKQKTLLNSDKLYGLTTIDRVNKELKNAINIYPRYTKNINDLFRNPEMSLFLDFGICNSGGLYKLDLIKEMTIAEDLKNHQLGYYRGEIVLYSWKETSGIFSYSVHTLSRRNKFGNPICYTNTTSGTKDIKNYMNGTIKNIRYFSGKYISVTIKPFSGKNEFYSVYNIDTEDWVQLDSENHVMDLWGIDSQIIELPRVNELSISTLTSFCPDIINSYFDIKNYTYKLDVERKIGEWYVLNQTRRSDSTRQEGYFKIYTNMTKTIVLSNTKDYIDEEPIVINNNILALRSKVAKPDLDYYTYFVGDGTYYSEKALLVLKKLYLGSGEMYYPENNKVPETIKSGQDVINFYKIQAANITDSGEDKLLELGIEPNIYYTDNKLVYNYGTNLLVDHIGSSFTESYISGFRRNTCPIDLRTPNIIGSVNGLIYYKTKDNKIKLL